MVKIKQTTMKKILFSILFALISTLSFAQVPSYIPTNGLLGWWPFNGNANDESGNGNNGANNGATLTTDRNGNVNSAYSFDGNSGITIPHSTSLIVGNSSTFSFWLKYNSLSNGFNLVFKKGIVGGCPDSGYYFAYDGIPGPVFKCFGYGVLGNCSGISDSSSLDNQWHNIVVVYNLQNSQIYFDGILQDGDANNNINQAIFNTVEPLIIGYYNGPYSGTSWNGLIDDFGIWNRALTDCEIQNLYTSTNPTQTTTQTACDSYTWNGQTYSASGTYTGTTANCVTQVLNLTITPSITNTTTQTACGSYIWNGQTYTASGTYTATTANCVTQVLNLTITPNSINITPVSACESYTWNGQTYTASGTYTGTTANCVTQYLYLTITPSSTNTTTQTACGSYTWNGQTYSASGTYTGTTENCVTQVLNLTITPSTTNTTTQTACDSYTWNGQTYSASGTYTGTTANCVTQYLYLTITPSSTITQPASQSNNISNDAQFIVSSSDPSATYQWQTNLGFGFQNLNNAGQYNGTTSSTLNVINLSMSNNNQVFRCIISSGSCTDTSDVAVLTVVNNVGFNKLSASKLSIYPNPTNGDFTITGLELVGSVSSLTLTDMNGKVVKVLDTKATKFSMASIKPGVYFLNIISGNKQEVLKIVKE